MSDLQNFRLPLKNVRFSCTNRLAVFFFDLQNFPLTRLIVLTDSFTIIPDPVTPFLMTPDFGPE